MANSDAGDRITPPKSNPPPSDTLFGEYHADVKPWKMLLYGASGSGKTYMAGTFPDPIFIDLEDGMRSLSVLGKKILRYPSDPTKVVDNFKLIPKIYQAIKALNPREAPFKTIVVDSLNELQVLMLKHALSLHSADRIYGDQPTIGDYGKLARDMQSVVRDFFQLPFHIIFTVTAQDREYEDEKLYPMLVGKKSGPDLRRISEQIGYCYTQQKNKNEPPEHMVSFNDSPSFLAKDRSSFLTRPIPNNYQAMAKLAEETRKQLQKRNTES